MIYLIWLDLRQQNYWKGGMWWTIRWASFESHARILTHLWLERKMGMTQAEWMDRGFFKDRPYHSWPLSFCKLKPFDVKTFFRLLTGYYDIPKHKKDRI